MQGAMQVLGFTFFYFFLLYHAGCQTSNFKINEGAECYSGVVISKDNDRHWHVVVISKDNERHDWHRVSRTVRCDCCRRREVEWRSSLLLESIVSASSELINTSNTQRTSKTSNCRPTVTADIAVVRIHLLSFSLINCVCSKWELESAPGCEMTWHRVFFVYFVSGHNKLKSINLGVKIVDL